MKLFIGIDLPEEIKNYLYEIQNKIKNNKLAKINWVFKKNLHLTLKFLGEMEENKLSLLKERLSNIKNQKFNLTLLPMGIFPDVNNPRIMWVGIKKEEKLFELQRKIDESTIDLSNESMSFAAHLTLGRIKLIKNKKEFLKQFEEIKIEDLNFKIKKFALFKSKTMDEWLKLNKKYDFCCEPVKKIQEVLNDSHFNSRKTIIKLDGLKQIAMPVLFSSIEKLNYTKAPKLGEHTSKILSSIGYNKEYIRNLRTKGVLL